MRISHLLVPLLLVITTFPALAAGPSFACTQVEADSSEAIICGDKVLSALDRDLAAVYAKAREKAGKAQTAALKEEQENWVNARNNCKGSEDYHQCFTDAYRLRNMELQAHYNLWPKKVDNINALGFDRLPILFKFIALGRIDMVEPLINRGAIVDGMFGGFDRNDIPEPRDCRMKTLWGEPFSNPPANCRVTAFDQAALAPNNGAEIVNLLLSLGTNATAGICDSRFISNSIYQQLLDNIQNPKDAVCDDGQTLLDKTIRNPERVKLLIEKGADVNRKSITGFTPMINLVYALKANEEIDTDSPIRRSFDLLYAHGSDLNVRGRWDDFPLSHAVQHQLVDMVKILLEHGANPNMRRLGQQHDLELLESAATGYSYNNDILQLLLKHGADTNIPTKSGKPLLLTAVTENRLEIAKTLIAHGADINIKNKDGDSLYRIADDIYRNNRMTGMRELLVDSGIDIQNIRNRANEPALYSAVYEDNYELVSKLLEHGADPLYQSQGSSVLDRAKTKEMHELLQKYMTKAGAPQAQVVTPASSDLNASSSHYMYARGGNINGAFATSDDIIWDCGNGFCQTLEAYTDKLDMDACHEISRKVGGLTSFSNDAGMVWNNEQNPELLEQCNQRGLFEHAFAFVALKQPSLFFIMVLSIAVFLLYGFIRFIWTRNLRNQKIRH